MTSPPATDAIAADEPTVELRRGHAPRRFLELLALTGFAITQPVLDAFGDSPEHFTFRGATPAHIVWFALVIALVPPVVLSLLTLGVDVVSARVGRVTHLAVIAVLAGLTGIQLGWRALELSGVSLLLLAIGVGGAVAALHSRFPGFRVWVRFTAVLPAAAVALFLFSSPVSDLVWSRTSEATALELEDAPPIVVLVFDELPTATLMGADGDIDAELFPNFARLREISTWYRNNSTNSNNTTLAVPAMLTGRVPSQLQATLANHPENLYTLLGRPYDIRADEAPMQLCPSNLCREVNTPGDALRELLSDARRLWRSQVSIRDPGTAGFDLLEETVDVEEGATAAPSTAQEVFAGAVAGGEQLITNSPARHTDFLEAIGRSSRPTLDYLHLQLPHGPFRFYPDGKQYLRPDAGQDAFNRYALRGDSEIPADVDRQRHILQTQFADALVGQLLDRLEDEDLLDESIIIVASDHGISFDPGVTPRLNTEEELVETSIDDVFWSALFMKHSRQERGEISDAPTQLIDVVPTLIDWLDADPGWDLDGVSVDQLGERPLRTLCRPWVEDGLFTMRCEERDGTAMLDQLLASSAGDFVPAGDPALRVYQTGRFGALVGRSLDELELTGTTSQEVEMENLDNFADVRAGGPLPGLLRGALASGDDGVDLVFSLNGTVAAATESFPGDRRGEINAILPPSLFVAGANELEVYVVEGSVAAPVLSRAALTAG